MLWPISNSKPGISFGGEGGDYKSAVMIPLQWAIFYINERSMLESTVGATVGITNLYILKPCQYWGNI